MLHFPSRRIELCRIYLPIHQLPRHLNGLKLVQLSDFHFGNRGFSEAMLQETVEIVQQIQPDLICYTGDFINGNVDAIAILCESLRSIQGRYGSVAVLGNHDYFEPGSAAIVTESLEQINIHVLKDEVCYPMGAGLAIVGFQCLFAYQDLTTLNPDRLLSTIAAGIPKIVLTHGPRYNELLARWTIDLHLSGHTHGGQLSLPWIGPLLPKFWQLFYELPGWLQQKLIAVLPHRLMSNQDCRHFRGLYPRNQGYLYVNRGLGAHFPGRLFCRPEITAITLTAVDSTTQNPSESTELLTLSEIKT